MGLTTYQSKRDFQQTAEPRGAVTRTGLKRFVVQEHHASHLHYDFRLEMAGVLKSWAVPKGPSMDPKVRRLAVAVEDHPVDYIHFEGRIPEKNYGAGDVAVWDAGDYEVAGGEDPEAQLERGHLSFTLHGRKLRGDFSLIRKGKDGRSWLLIKKRDEAARPVQELQPQPGQGGKTATPPRAFAGQPRRAPQSQAGRITADVTQLHEAQPEPMPQHVSLMLAHLVDKPFSGKDWIFESKWDGIRTLCYLASGQARLVTRNGHDITARYPELKALPEYIQARQAILDGEIVALNGKGVSDFQRLQSRMGVSDPVAIQARAAAVPAVYYLFDILYCDGFNLMPVPLLQRKELLHKIIKPNETIRYSSYISEQGEEFFREARRLGLEGIMAKHAGSPYVQARSGKWLKIKAQQRQEAVIAGYTAPRQSRKHFGALVVGLYAEGKLKYVGHVGGGFNSESLRDLYTRLQPLKTKRSPFAVKPRTNEPVQWVRPQLVAEIKFANWTGDRKMRQPVFVGLREDKPPRQCHFEKTFRTETEISRVSREVKDEKRATAVVSSDKALSRRELTGELMVKARGTPVELTHLERVLWPDEGYTKGDMLRYYQAMSKFILPYLKDRPLILKRYPAGIHKPFFFQHDVDTVPGYVETYSTLSEEGRPLDYILCNNPATLLYVVNLGAIAQNPWHSRVGSVDKPDWVVFDLDPGDVKFASVCGLALAVRDVLERLGLESYPKTSGATGLHVYVPVRVEADYTQAAAFAAQVARLVARENRRLVTLERSPKKRGAGTIYLDHLQNARGKSVVAPYSLREQKGATVSAPLDWKEVKAVPDPQDYNIQTMPARVRRRGDLFKDVLRGKQNLTKAMRLLEKMG